MRAKTRLLILAGLAAVFFTGCVELDVAHLFLWDPIALEGSPFAFNRVALLTLFASFLCILFFLVATRKMSLVPKKLQSIAETGYLFVRDQIAIDTIGPDGAKYTNYLASLFFFIFFLNILEIVPGISFPVPSRMAIPAVLALLTYIIFNIVGMKSQGPWRYFKDSIWFPEAPLPIRILLAIIELVSIFVFRPLTLAIRLLANMMAGHVLLTIFFLFTHMFLVEQFPSPGSAMGIVTLLVACALIIFELLVIFIQAYIFTMLSAFYIAEATHGHGDHDEEHEEVKHEKSDTAPLREVEGLGTA